MINSNKKGLSFQGVIVFSLVAEGKMVPPIMNRAFKTLLFTNMQAFSAKMEHVQNVLRPVQAMCARFMCKFIFAF